MNGVRKTQAEFLAEIKAIHGNAYRCHSQYVNGKTKVTMECKKHGKWDVLPTNLISRKSGCPSCRYIKSSLSLRKGSADFLAKLKAVHGNRYKLIGRYVDTRTRVKMHCKKHGNWMAYPNNLTHKIRASGCPECGRIKGNLSLCISHEEFEKRVKAIYGERYEILSKYNFAQQKMKFRCAKHGIFMQFPHALYDGTGCGQCGREQAGKTHRMSNAEFVKRVKELHGGSYQVLDQYQTAYQKVQVKCHKHGVWLARPRSLLKGQGCPSCVVFGFNTAKPADFYLKKIRYQNKIYYGFGVTNVLEQRDSQHGTQLRKHGAILLEQQAWHFAKGKQALDIETAIKADQSIPTDNILPIKGFVSEAFVAKDLSKAMKYLLERT